MRVGVIGTGTMGTGLAQLFCQADFINTVVWIYKSEGSKTVSMSKLHSRWMSSLNKNKFSDIEINQFQKKIDLCNTYEKLSGLDFVIEAVNENISIKKQVFSDVSVVLDEKTIFATNTSSLSVTEISSVVHNKQNVVGLHFFNPAPVMKLTEVVSGFLTSSNAINFAVELSIKLGKMPVLVNEAPGFVVNRMLIPMINEAIAVYAEGVASASDIDAAMVNGANHPIGPLALADMIGNDICLSIMEVLRNETGDPKYRAHPLLRKMVRAGKLGRKTGEGFFCYQ